MTNEEIKLLKNFITWQSLPFADNLFTHEDDIIKKFDEWLRLNVGSNYRITNEEAREIIKQMCAELSFYENKKYEALELAIKALEDIEKIKAIIRTPSYFLEQDVYRYKKICEVIANERKTESKEVEKRT